ncbi:hypothetical protein HZC00_01235 [Candidatus Kaiserbacteria bacterium]|nr:hypothetical protein [Candidatus Kaiserbacteria bacterium]
MGIESGKQSAAITPQEAMERDALRATIEDEKKKEREHELFKEAVLEKVNGRLADFAEQNSIKYESFPLGEWVSLDQENQVSFHCKENSDWEKMSSFLDSEVATFSEMLVTQEGGQVILYPEKDPAHRTYKITLKG